MNINNITVVIVSYYRGNRLNRCLDTLKNVPNIIVWDNNTTGDELEKVKSLKYLLDDVEYKPWITDLVNRHMKELSKDSFQILNGDYSIRLEIEFKKIVERQIIQFKISLTGDIMTKAGIDFKPQYSIKDLPSQYSKIYFDKRYRFKKEELMDFSNILARLKISTPIEYEKFKDFKDIKEIFVIDKNLDKFLEDKKIETDDKFDNNIDNNII